MLDGERKLAREKREAGEKKDKVGETLNILSWQNDARRSQAVVDAEKKVME
jgi:hypothetical protein